MIDGGGRSAGLAHANVALQDEWGIFNNIASIAKLKYTTIVASGTKMYAVDDLKKVNGGVVLPIKYGNIAAGLSRFGDDLMNISDISMGWANKVGFINLGLRVKYRQYQAEGFGNASGIMISFGGIVEILPNLSLGARINNMTQSHIATEYGKEPLPSNMEIGLLYRPVSKLLLTGELAKDLRYPLRPRLGIEYTILDKIFLRTGVQTYPVKNFFGLGLLAGRFRFDYAFSLHQQLGSVHLLSINYTFK